MLMKKALFSGLMFVQGVVELVCMYMNNKGKIG